MKTKLIVSLILVVLFAISIIMIGGCGSTSTSYFYYYPDWTPDGRILATKSTRVTSSGSGMFGGSGQTVTSTYSLVIMDDDGTNETEIKGIGNGGRTAASPLGNYYAYTVIGTNYIYVVDTSGTQISQIDCGGEILSLDWAPDETKLIYLIKQSDTYNSYAVDIGGSSSTIVASDLALSNVAWRKGNKILCYGDIGSDWGLRVLSDDGYSAIISNANAKGDDINVLQTNTSEAVYRWAGIYKINITSSTASPELLIDRNDLWNIKVSPSGQKIIATGDNASGSEIWIINIDGTGLTQLK